MRKNIKAKFYGGVLVPLEPLDIPEGAMVVLDIDPSFPEPEMATTESSALPNHRGFVDEIDPEKLNQLNDELIIEEYLAKERRIRKRGE